MKKLASIFFFSLLFIGCTIQPTELEFKSFHKKSFSPRDNKAVLTLDKSMHLILQGYVLIGYIDLRQNLTICYPDSGCQKVRDSYIEDAEGEEIGPAPKNYPREDELGYEIAEVGGDKFNLLEEKAFQDKISKQVCSYYYTTSYVIDGKLYSNTTCSNYYTVHGTLDVKIKRALAWRFAPELASSEDNINALKHALETITKKLNPEQSLKPAEMDTPFN